MAKWYLNGTRVLVPYPGTFDPRHSPRFPAASRDAARARLYGTKFIYYEYSSYGWAWSVPEANGVESLGQDSSFVPELGSVVNFGKTADIIYPYNTSDGYEYAVLPRVSSARAC